MKPFDGSGHGVSSMTNQANSWTSINRRSNQNVHYIMAKIDLLTSSYCFIWQPTSCYTSVSGCWFLFCRSICPKFFQAGNSTIGIVLSCYTVAALCIRPFSGYLLDTFARKPLYLFAYFIFITDVCRISYCRFAYLIYHVSESFTESLSEWSP